MYLGFANNRELSTLTILNCPKNLQIQTQIQIPKNRSTFFPNADLTDPSRTEPPSTLLAGSSSRVTVHGLFTITGNHPFPFLSFSSISLLSFLGLLHVKLGEDHHDPQPDRYRSSADLPFANGNKRAGRVE